MQQSIRVRVLLPPSILQRVRISWMIAARKREWRSAVKVTFIVRVYRRNICFVLICRSSASRHRACNTTLIALIVGKKIACAWVDRPLPPTTEKQNAAKNWNIQDDWKGLTWADGWKPLERMKVIFSFHAKMTRIFYDTVFPVYKIL